MIVNYIDLGLGLGEEIQAIHDIIFPELDIVDYNIVGFEACRENFDKVKKYPQDNKVKILHKAVGSKNETVKLYRCYKGFKGHSIYKTKSNILVDNFENVECVILSDWIKENLPKFSESFNILRMNIEGAEWDVITDLDKNDMLKHIDIFAGAADLSRDIRRVSELETALYDYLNILERYKIKPHKFTSGKPHKLQGIKDLIKTKLEIKNGGFDNSGIIEYFKNSDYIFDEIEERRFLVQDHNEWKDFMNKVSSISKINFGLEIGSNVGGTFYSLSKIAEDDATLISVDLYDKSTKAFRSFEDRKAFFKEFNPNQTIHSINGDSMDLNTINRVKEILHGNKLDYLFIDGLHDYHAVKSDFENYSPLVRKGGIIAFHDISHRNKGSFTFWNEIDEEKTSFAYSDVFGIGFIIKK